jgi:magnesium-transporting ATPase (P-type)
VPERKVKHLRTQVAHFVSQWWNFALISAEGLTGHAVLTPMLMVLVMITGDFLSMSLTTDRVRPSETPNSWNIGRITSAAIILGGCSLAFFTAVLLVGKFELRLDIEALRTISVVAIVYSSQAIIYAIRARRHFWGPNDVACAVLCCRRFHYLYAG